MPTITTKDGAQIFYKDWGSGQPVVFSHGWPLNADAWDEQLFLLANNGFRAIAHDRRGHGRSTQTWTGNDMDTYADDLAALVETLNLTNAIHVGHSTGGGEVARYIGRHGTTRVAKAVLVDAVPPGLLQTPKNPDGMPIAVFDQIRAGLLGESRRSSGRTSASSFTAPIGRAPRFRKACTTRSGCSACSAGSSRPTTASKRSPRATSPRTSRSSTSRR